MTRVEPVARIVLDLRKEKDMHRIWAPWRIEYIQMEKPQSCIFCEKPGQDKDDQNYILYRGKQNFVMLNAYPYNSGHLLVIPYRHLSRLDDLTAEELGEHPEIVRRCVGILREVFEPDGFNLGMNLGRVAGAGVDKHIHTHIVPRWNGDTNCMAVLGEVRVIPEHIRETHKKLRVEFNNQL